MISEFVREQKRYTQKELCQILKCSEEYVVSLIRKLKEFGVLKAVKSSYVQKNMADLLEEDIEVVDVEVGENEYLYVFTFVGVIVAVGRVLKCYPKYLLNVKEPADELRKVIKVLEKYNSKEQIVRMFNDSSESSSFNLLAVLLFLLQDYFENGVYTNTEDIIECNGSGEILWDKTINETFTLLSENRPYYTELQTRKRVTNDFDYFKRLHECVVTMASKELQDAELLNLFEMSGIDLTDEELEDFGDKEYILYRIENELNTQFNTRKQLVLKTMYAYIDRRGSLYDTDCLSLFGTNSFNLVWEKVCADIMDNQLDVALGALKLPVPLKDGYNRRQKLIELIEKPLWTLTGKCAKDTLIPDLISICKVSGQYQFIIFDAKYYNAHLEKGIAPTDQPGIESVTKQYLYQLAYQKFIDEHEFASVKNCFLLPTENSEIEDKGEVRMQMLSSLGLQDVKTRLIPATMAYDLYLSGRKMDIDTLKL
jgi:llaJI restriction endonuclease